MNKLWLLLKKDFLEITGVNKILKEKSKRNKFNVIAILLTVLMTILMMGVLCFMYFNMIADSLDSLNYIQLIISITILGSSAMAFFTSIYKAPGILFGGKDYDILMSLPVKSSTILASKILNLIAFNYLSIGIILIPGIMVYFLRTYTSPIIFIYALVMYIFIPFVPIVIASIFAFFISSISSRIRFKNLIEIVGSTILCLTIIYFSSNSNNVIEYIGNLGESITDTVNKIYFPAYYFTEGIVSLNFISVMKFILISLGFLILFVFILNKSYKKINSRMGESYKKSNYKLSSLKKNTPVRALINKEIKRYFSSSIYVLNTSFGLVLLTLLSLSIAIFGEEKIMTLLELPYLNEYKGMMIVVIITFCIAISCTTCSSISIEGKNIWILKSLPVRVEDIFKSKIAVNLLLFIPAILVNAAILWIPLKLSIIELLWIIIIPFLSGVYIALLGLIINLYFPKLEWASETIVVKQSLAVFLSLLMGMLSVGGCIAFYNIFNISNNNIFMIGISVVLIILIVLLWNLLKNKGSKLFSKL